MRGKETLRIEGGVAQELEGVAVNLVGSTLGHRVHDAAGIVAVFRVEIVGQHTEFGNGIQIRNDRRAAVHQLLDVGPVDEKSVGIFALPVDGLVSRIQAAGRRDRHDDTGHDNRSLRLRRHWHDAGLKRQQIGEAPAVQADCGHHLAGDDVSHLRALSLDLQLKQRKPPLPPTVLPSTG